MSSELNDTSKNEKKDYMLGFTVVLDDGTKLEFPPLVNNIWPIPISERALREYIAQSTDIIEIPAKDGGNPEVVKNGRKPNSKEDKENDK